MRTRALVALVSSVVGAAVVSGAAGFGAWAGIRGQRAASQRVVDMLPVHADWWRERLHHEGQLTYLAIGDSAAQGVGATAPGRGYVGLLARRIRHRSRMTLRVVNLSVSGATTWGARQHQLPKLRQFTPDICTVSIGANDISDFHPDKFERNIRAIYGAVPSHAIVAELPCMFVPDRERKVAVANEIVHRVAGELGLTVAPLHAITKRVGIRRTFFNTYGDLFHPNDRGYEIWASAFEPAVDARVDTVAAIRRYLSAREAEDLGSQAGDVAHARAEQDTDGAAALDTANRPNSLDRLRQRVTGSVPLPGRHGSNNDNGTSTGTGTGAQTDTDTAAAEPSDVGGAA
ncbi:SGNH/GDSL hydrolase family protein [Curtobacterium sp. MCSS17_015]|uniref:SGNH/GDSL hydrolase family protein n=1 Tax=Curtobacterium sp. MCSS17_015 TaxID=2175666 RepID=UPI0015E893C1|nr:SGNH/GDSL hydrolase family protein [Curtobacterium sp. MCSS17_015]WIB26654.1 SGNH/GDSL hydrolase family protein [Curtobacterium sp. MCSS17_015]